MTPHKENDWLRTIESFMEEFDARTRQLQKYGGWNVPYEGTDIEAQSIWLRSAITSLLSEIVEDTKKLPVPEESMDNYNNGAQDVIAIIKKRM